MAEDDEEMKFPTLPELVAVVMTRATARKDEGIMGKGDVVAEFEDKV